MRFEIGFVFILLGCKVLKQLFFNQKRKDLYNLYLFIHTYIYIKKEKSISKLVQCRSLFHRKLFVNLCFVNLFTLGM